MKKIISVILAICFVAGVFCFPVAATYADQTSTAYFQVGTTAYDLGAYGLHTFSSYYVTTPPTVNGKIDAGEYNGSNIPSDVATIGDGLSLTNALGITDYTKEYGDDYKDFTIKTYLAYDDTYAYIAEEVSSDQGIDLGSSATLNATVRYGLNQSATVSEAASRLSNSYSFKVGASITNNKLTSADRVYRKLDGEVIESVVPDADPYNDGTTSWTRDEYAKNENTSVSMFSDGGRETYVLEFRIPLADLAFSATGRQSKEDVASLIAGGNFYGSFFFQIAVTRSGGPDSNQQFFLATGKPGNGEILPYSANATNKNGTTWSQAVKEYWTTAKGESFSVSNVHSPVIHNAKSTVAPSTPVVHPTTGFRPGMTGHGLGEIKSAYKLGETATFTVIPDGVENTSPATGDTRMVPTMFRLRKGTKTVYTGKFSADFKTGSFKTDAVPTGLNTLVVTFSLQRFDGTKWVDTGTTKNLSRNITIAGAVKAASSGASQTGDTLALAIVAGSVILLGAGTLTVAVLRKRKTF